MNKQRKTSDLNWLSEAIDLASRLVVAKDFLGTYQTTQMQTNSADIKKVSSVISKVGAIIGDEDLMGAQLQIRQNMQAVDELLTVTPDQWANNFKSIGRQRKAITLFESAIAIAQPRLAAAPTELCDTLEHKTDFPSECSAAYRRTREHLISQPQSPRWPALLLFTLARAIGSNTRAAYSSDEWHDGTFFWFRIEQAWLKGDGHLVGSLLLEANKTFFMNKVAVNLGADMPRRLAESASIAPGWPLFNPPW